MVACGQPVSIVYNRMSWANAGTTVMASLQQSFLTLFGQQSGCLSCPLHVYIDAIGVPLGTGLGWVCSAGIHNLTDPAHAGITLAQVDGLGQARGSK